MITVECEWAGPCSEPATRLRHHPIRREVPICDRCNDTVTRTGVRRPR